MTAIYESSCNKQAFGHKANLMPGMRLKKQFRGQTTPVMCNKVTNLVRSLTPKSFCETQLRLYSYTIYVKQEVLNWSAASFFFVLVCDDCLRFWFCKYICLRTILFY